MTNNLNQGQKATQNRRGRIFPDQWTPEKIAEWKANYRSNLIPPFSSDVQYH